ncbi:MacS family sensor histidine kinase [Streptomyces sp. 796.1]|uniref:MacS family sensor histidine kinase n=1 Tax=Streptomyces sp. 796.1 TaxID=3163029 RepID=UPI0039C99CE0
MAQQPTRERPARERVVRMSVELPLWRALTGYRVLTALYAIGLYVHAYDEYEHPLGAGAYMLLLAGWMAATWRMVGSAERCTKRFLIADLGVAIVGIVLTPLVDTHQRVIDGGPTLPSIWTAGAVLGFAIKGGWRWGAVASAVVGAANIIERGAFAQNTVHNVLLVWVASVAIGYVVEVARASERTLARALQIEAATRERERLARDIHDSVLQVLAMVQRRGVAIGGEAAELGRMAGEQEVALRTLISSGIGRRDQRAVQVAAGADPRSAAQRAAPAGRTGAAATPSAPAAAATDPAGPIDLADPPGADFDADFDTTFGTGVDADFDADPYPDEPRDLRDLLAPHAGAKVSLAEPGAPVLLPAHAARELAGAVGAALDNVRRHAGDGAQAWILIEDEPDQVIVTVRDDGPGIPAGRLADAEREGRLGVALSIRGRLRDLGGSAELVSVPGQGTEVELRVPRGPRGRKDAR